MTDNIQLMTLLEEQGLEKSNSLAIVEAFGGPFDEAGVILATYKEIKVTDESQVQLMARARESRLALKKARTTVENNRKMLKEGIVKQGKAIDSVARFVKETIQPAEEYLEQQEKFAEIRMAERAAALKAERLEALSKYSDNLSIYNLDTMTDATYTTLLADLKQAHEARIAQEKAEREAAEQRERERLAEEKRIREENERLRAEASAKEAEREAERKAEAEQQAKVQAEKEKAIAAERAKADTERKKREALELERHEEQKRLERERVKREEAEAAAKAAAEKAELDALLAPDKDKLIAFSNALQVIQRDKLPAVKTKRAQDVVTLIDEMFTKMRGIIEKKAEEL